MKYSKPTLSFPDQADLLLSRGIIADREELINCLKAVSYYRLSAYWHTFRQPDDSLRPGTTLATIWRRYTFDRQLRLLVMDAIERVEIAVRTQIVNRFSAQFGPFEYCNRANLPGLSADEHQKFLENIRREAKNSQEEFVRHYFQKYSSETDLPLWMACELMTFGAMFTLYRGMTTRMKKDIASEYGIHAPVLSSWLRTLNQVRNICAHHARLWNRQFGVKPLIPEIHSYPAWHSPVPIDSDKIFGVLTILRYLLGQVAPKSQWRKRLFMLFEQYAEIPKRFMGFPDNWGNCPIWK